MRMKLHSHNVELAEFAEIAPEERIYAKRTARRNIFKQFRGGPRHCHGVWWAPRDGTHTVLRFPLDHMQHQVAFIDVPSFFQCGGTQPRRCQICLETAEGRKRQ